MPQLGSSPLGLVMDSTNNTKVRLGNYVLSSGGTQSGSTNYYKSLFGRSGNQTTHNFDFRREDNSTYEITTENIVSFCQNHKMMTLSYADFAYLKNLGVYPNNRLMIARRFASPVTDDLIDNELGDSPLATLISWVPDNENYFSVEFSENWVDAETSFKDVLNDASQSGNILTGDNKGLALGTFLAEGARAIPLAGWSDGLQYSVFKALGLTDRDYTDLPFGNPNLVRKGMRRATAGKDDEFEGVKAKISVKMVVEYEQKFIAGIDPTVVYYDIIANALSFGTSESKFMFRSDTLNSGEFGKFLDKLGSGNTDLVLQALGQFANALWTAFKEVKKALTEALSSLFEDQASQSEDGTEGELSEETGASFIEKTLFGLGKVLIGTVVNKYKVRLVAVLNTLTGYPSAPWHVTIGNPRRPVFSSGDMLVQDVSVTLGKVLAYNDLPSSIKVEFTLTNARGLGAQEIFAKLNCGIERSYRRTRGDLSSNDAEIKIDETTPKAPVKLEATQTNAQSDSNKEAPLDNSGQLNNLGSALQSASSAYQKARELFKVGQTIKAVRDLDGKFYDLKIATFEATDITANITGPGTYGNKKFDGSEAISLKLSLIGNQLYAFRGSAEVGTFNPSSSVGPSTQSATNSARNNLTTQNQSQTAPVPGMNSTSQPSMAMSQAATEAIARDKAIQQAQKAVKAHNDLIDELNKILLKLDTYGPGGTRLLKQFKTRLDDNESGAIAAIKQLVNSGALRQKTLDLSLNREVKVHFDEKVYAPILKKIGFSNVIFDPAGHIVYVSYLELDQQFVESRQKYEPKWPIVIREGIKVRINTDF